MSEPSINESQENMPLNILLVEDNEADVKITLRAFEKDNIKNYIFVVNTGEQALEYLRGLGDYNDRERYPKPDLILLDLNMPKVDGFEVLKSIKFDNQFNYIPVIVLTSSESQRDILNSYRCGAASYIQKPVDYEDFVKIVKGLNHYWGVINKRPSHDDA